MTLADRPAPAIAPVRIAIEVAAEPALAFDVFTAGMGRWWLRSHRLGAAAIRDVVIEPRAGGRWYEIGEDGREWSWGGVLAWDPPSRVVLDWQLDADWRFDPDHHTTVEVHFTALGAGRTRVDVEHRDLERYGDRAVALRQAIDSAGGWPGLLDSYRLAASAAG